jgi:mono/diheme cytochrome c family protein
MTFLLLALALAAQEPSLPGTVSGKLDPELKGRVLVEELNCAACHPADPSLAARTRKAPRLAGVGSRVNPAYLEAFVRDPRGTKPGTTMPDLLGRLDPPARAEAVAALVHYLASMKKGDFALEAPDAVAAEQGRRLFHARGCAACHAPRDERGSERTVAASLPLGAMERKYGFRGLVDFLRQPLAVRPSGRMPDLRLPGQDAERIAHFLLRETRVPGALSYTLYRGPVWEGLESEQVKAERAGQTKDFSTAGLGDVRQHSAVVFEGWIDLPRAGRYAFFLTMNGGSLSVDGTELLRLPPSDRRGVKSVEGAAELAAGRRRIRLVYFHTGREASLAFDLAGPELERRPVPSSMLSAFEEPVPPLQAFRVDVELAARGRRLFGTLGCAACHDDLQPAARSAPAWDKLQAGRGCLGGRSGPDFGLSEEQRGWIARALPSVERPEPDDRRRLDQALAAFNCIACHEREGLGGVAPERKELFTGTQPEMGNQGRLPPPLTQVGAKMTPEGIADALLRGKRPRGYLDASMPQFGEANVGALVELFGRVDLLEPAGIPEVDDLRAFKEAGRRLIGTSGLSCIACHDFNGQPSAGMRAVDLVGTTERLRKNWFHLYLREPSRFHPLVTMPTYWPDGKAALPGVLGGDAGRQIEALWRYLEDGSRVGKPEGLSRQSTELRVGDVAEICRGRSSVGYRGIAVGYPERIHLVFDSEEMALRFLWKGDFASLDLGSFQPRGTDRIALPPGIPFHRPAGPDDPWPYKGKTRHAFPQDHGYRFLGYQLDVAREPTFRYRYGELAVEDRFDDLRDPDGKAYFRRTLSFEAPAGLAPFQFRAAAGKGAVRDTDREFRVGALRLRLLGEHQGVVREGDPGEVLVPLAPPEGRSEFRLEYRW